MLNKIDNSQVSFNGSVHQMNKLSKKLSDGKTLTKVIGDQLCYVPAKVGGELANFRKLDDGRIIANLANYTEIKDGVILTGLSGTGKTKAGAARDFINRIKDGVRLVTDAYGSERAEYFVKQDKNGLAIKKLNTSI